MFTKKPDRPTTSIDQSRQTLVAVPTAGTSANSASWATGPGTKGYDSASASVIGADLIITGSLRSNGEVTIEGEVQGDIQCGSLLVGETARVQGNVLAEEVVIRGRVEGSVRGNRVALQSTSHVEGDVFHRSLAIEQGAFFEGKSRRSEDPIGTAPKPADIGLLTGGNGNGRSGLYGDSTVG
jgi:cytoskeletal protein CcmA (bactofilin family)